MNSKKAKALRRTAKENSEAAPAVGFVTLRNGQSINVPYSQRGLYRMLKKYDKGEAHHAKDV